MSVDFREQNVDRLDVSCSTIDLLKENKITKLSQLTRNSRNNLKDIGVNSMDIDKINVELQFLGMGLRGS